MADKAKRVKLTSAQGEVIDALCEPGAFLERTPHHGYSVKRCIEKPTAKSWGRYECLLRSVRSNTMGRLQDLGLIELRTMGRYYAAKCVLDACVPPTPGARD